MPTVRFTTAGWRKRVRAASITLQPSPATVASGCPLRNSGASPATFSHSQHCVPNSTRNVNLREKRSCCVELVALHLASADAGEEMKEYLCQAESKVAIKDASRGLKPFNSL